MKKTVALFLILFLVILKSGAQCFTLVYEGNGVDHMNFYFTGATVNGVNLQPGDEIGIFDGNLCVGRATLTQVLTGGVLLPGVASSDDNTTPEIDGYTAGHAITYRLCSGGTVITNVTATYSLGTGTFAVGATVQLSLAGITECTNPPLLTLAETSGSTCGINPVTVTGNTFGGSATSVTITTNGQGTLTPLSANTSPFSFSYTPATADAGQTVVIEVTTDNPEGAPCTPASSSYSLTVNPLPSTSNITGNATPACNATGIVYSVTGLAGSTYAWSVPTEANIFSGQGTNSITVNFGQSNGNITVTETSAAGCVGPQRTLAITLQGCGLDADFSANPLNVCTGSQVTFTNATAGATPAAAYSWNFGSGATPASATGAGPHNVVYSTVGSKTVTLTVTEGVTSTETKTDYITVNTVPSAPSAITGTASICRPQTDVTYSVPPLAGATSYQWNYTGQGADIVGNTNTVTISFNSSATSGILTVQGVNDCGNGQWSQGYNITVNAMPSQSPVTGPAAPPCRSAGNVYSVTATAGSNYVWEVPVDADITLGQGTSSITVTFGSTDGHVSVTETNAAGCTGAPRSLYVELQGCGLNADFTAEPRTVCAGSSVVFSNTSGGTSGNTTFAWNFGEGATPATAATAGPHTVSYSSGGSKTVSLTITDGASDTETKTGYITVNPLPAAAETITGTPSVCRGSSASYTVPAISGATSYSWVYSGQGADINGTTNTVTINFSSTATSGTLTVRGVNSCGNGTLSQGYAITVNPLPPAPGVGEITQPTCTVATGSVVLTGLPAGNWTINPGNRTGTGSTVTITGLTPDTYNFTVTNSNGCTSEESADIIINAQPAIPARPVIGAVTQPTCAISTGSVGISGLPSTGTWILTRNPGGAQVSGTGTTFTVSGIPAGTYTYTVTAASGCVSVASDPFTINSPLPVPDIPVVSVNCQGGVNRAIVTVTSPSGAGLEYRLNSGAWQESNVFNNVANGNHRVTVRNPAGCTATTPEFSVNCGCVNPPLLTLSETTGSTCGTAPVTISGNTFGGSATRVTITENGAGSVSPGSSTASPFIFTYTPASGDLGRTVVITVTTDNPLGSPCANATATYTLTVNTLPAAPVRGTVTHPTCVLPTGSVVLNSLPGTGEWTITRTPGGQTTTGSGTSATITGLQPGTYTFTVTDANGCVSPSSGNVVINAQPATPSAPDVGEITQPTCAQSTGSVVLSGLPATGSWTLTRSPGNLTIPGSGATCTVSNIPPGTFTFTVTNAAGCVSPPSDEVVIVQQPNIPVVPRIGNITHPTCELATGTVVLENLPENGEWILTRYPGGATLTGTGSSATISSLPPGVYNFAVTNAEQCTSPVSGNAVINAQPPIPNAPVVGTITHPTFQVATGSVVLSGLPSPGSWTLIRYPDQFTSQGTGTARTVSGLLPGTYTFAVTNSYGCTSEQTGQVVINARPGAPRVIINNPPVICENETTDLTDPAVTAGSDPNLTFTYWTDAEATEAYTTPQAAPAGIYYIMGTSTAGYYSIRPVVVTADQLPVANAGPDTVLHYVFRTTLNAEIPAIGTGIWELVTGTGDIFDPAAPSTHVSGLSVGENVFSWTVTNGACDPVTDLMVVRVNNLTIPTLITPNEDGRNDYFEIRGLEETLGTTELTIFDRRGLKVYENNNYTNDEGNRWEGRDYNGNPLPEDTYFYVIRAANGVSISGYVVVRR
ncbi:MAG: gliding motility-associated C-terminal domain-containing protein [Bacteroidales bacterium]